MKNIRNITRVVMTMIAFLSVSLSTQAAEVVYRIVEYNKSIQDFKVAACGMVPKDSWVYFENKYGATTANRYNQIPRNNKAVLYLRGWQGCTIKSITLNMCSNKKSGQVGVTLSDGDTQLYKQSPVDFADNEWFGQWVSKDFGVYVDVTKKLDIPAITSDESSITIQGGTSEGSVYLNSITIEYDEAAGMELESPLGWVYEKLVTKSTLAEGDEVMIYRNGCAATDYDGIEKSQYLDVVAIASTTDVNDPDVLRFTLGKGDSQNMWTLTDQHGRALGATGKQALAWNEGNTQWTIALGYDGAIITNGNSTNGTLHYNEPTTGYTRFGLYTSKSLLLPFLYRKVKQNEPEMSRSLAFESNEMTVSLDEEHIALRPTIMPTSTTDKRIVWTSDNEEVATVSNGFVTLHNIGHANITAQTKDGGAESSVSLTVTVPTGINATSSDVQKDCARKVLKDHNIVIMNKNVEYGIDGMKK